MPTIFRSDIISTTSRIPCVAGILLPDRYSDDHWDRTKLSGSNYLFSFSYLFFPSYPHRERENIFCCITRGIEVVNVFVLEEEEKDYRILVSLIFLFLLQPTNLTKKKGTTKFPKVGQPILAVGVLSLCTTYLASLIIFISSFPLSIVSSRVSFFSSIVLYCIYGVDRRWRSSVVLFSHHVDT